MSTLVSSTDTSSCWRSEHSAEAPDARPLASPRRFSSASSDLSPSGAAEVVGWWGGWVGGVSSELIAS